MPSARRNRHRAFVHARPHGRTARGVCLLPFLHSFSCCRQRSSHRSMCRRAATPIRSSSRRKQPIDGNKARMNLWLLRGDCRLAQGEDKAVSPGGCVLDRARHAQRAPSLEGHRLSRRQRRRPHNRHGSAGGNPRSEMARAASRRSTTCENIPRRSGGQAGDPLPGIYRTGMNTRIPECCRRLAADPRRAGAVCSGKRAPAPRPGAAGGGSLAAGNAGRGARRHSGGSAV